MSTTASKNHPEQQEGEIFLSNSNDEDAMDGTNRTYYQCIGWKTKRRGRTAYDVNGKVVNRMFPVFVQIAEIKGEHPSVLKHLLGS